VLWEGLPGQALSCHEGHRQQDPHSEELQQRLENLLEREVVAEIAVS